MSDDLVNEFDITEDIFNDTNSNEEFQISDDDMRAFLNIVSKKKVTIETEADELLSRYFAATRQIRESK